MTAYSPSQDLGKTFAKEKHEEMKEREELEKEMLKLQTSVGAPKLLSILHKQRQQRLLGPLSAAAVLLDAYLVL